MQKVLFWNQKKKIFEKKYRYYLEQNVAKELVQQEAMDILRDSAERSVPVKEIIEHEKIFIEDSLFGEAWDKMRKGIPNPDDEVYREKLNTGEIRITGVIGGKKIYFYKRQSHNMYRTDDGRNSASPRLLAEALKAAAAVGRPVMIHAEDEEIIATAAGLVGDVTRTSIRPPAAETRAVDFGIRAVAHAGAGRLHVQHVSTAGSIDMIRRAKADGLAVTAEVTPHHLGMWLPLAEAPQPPSLAKVNPPLRSERDRLALIQALRDGIIDVVATDHAPHRAADKTDDYEASAAGFIGLETALATCLTLGGMGGDWIPVLVERLTAGPFRALGEAAGLKEPRLRIGEAATCVLFDPTEEWVVGEQPLFSLARNTPLLGTTLRGKVLLTLVDGVAVHHDTVRLPWSTTSV